MTQPAGVVLRAVRDSDDLDEINADCPTWFGGAPTRELMAVDDGAPKQSWVADLDGAAAGFAQVVAQGVNDGHRGIAYVFVRPESRRRGVGAALWQAVLDVASPDRVPGVMAQVDESDGTTMSVALEHGLTRRGLHLESELDLAGIDGLRHLATAPRAPDVVLRPLPEDADEATWRAFAEVYHRLIRDTPDNADGAEDVPFVILRAMLKEPWQVCGAWEGDRLVGFTSVMVRDAGAGRLNTMLTAVDRDRRGLGLATALKTTHALALHEAGWTTVVTQNMEGNAAILASNRTLGFVPTLRKRDLAFDHPTSRPA